MADRSDGKVVIEISGDASELVKSLQEVTTAARDGLSGAMEDAARAVRDATAAADNMAGAAARSGSAAGEAAEATEALADAGQESAEALEDAAKAADTAEDGLKDAAKAAEDAADAADDMADELKETSDASKKAEKDLDGLEDELDDVGDGFDDAGQKALTFRDILKGTVLGNIITGALKALKNSLVEIGKSLITNAAELRAANSQYAQTFGELSDQADAAVQRVADASGIVESRLRGSAASIYAFARSSGGSTAESMELMETSLRAAADAAAYYDVSLEDATDTLQSFLKGNFANDAALGVSCTETTRNAAAMELFGQKYADLSEIQKQQTLLKMVTDAQELSGAMGQAAREMDGWENVTGNLRATWNEFLANVGTPLLEALTPVLQSVTEKLQEIIDKIDWEKFSTVVSGFLNFIIDNYKAVGVALLAIAAGFLAISIASSPLTALVTAIVAIIVAITLLWTRCEGFRNFILGFIDVIKTLGQGFKDTIIAIRDVVLAVVDGIKAAVEKLVAFFQGVATVFRAIGTGFKVVAQSIRDAFISACNGIQNIWSGITGFFESIWQKIQDVFANVWDTFLQVGKDLIDGLKAGILARIQAVVDAAKSVVTAVKNVFTGQLDINSPSKVTEGYGKSIDEGLAKGMRKNAGKTVVTTQDIVKGIAMPYANLAIKAGEAGKKTAAVAQSTAQSVQKAAKSTAASISSASKTATDAVEEITDALTDDDIKRANDAFASAVQKGLQRIVDDYEDAKDAILEQQASLAERLGAAGDPFTQLIEGSALGQYGGMNALLEDLDLYDAWNEALQQLKDRGVSDSLLADWLETDMETAVEYAAKLLQLPPGQFDEYLELFEQRKQAAADMADAIEAEQARFTTLTDLNDDIGAIEAYGAAMEALRARGVSEELFAEIRDMERAEATEYANALLALSDEAWDEYLAAYEAKGEAARRVAEEVFGPEVQALEDEFLATLPDKLEDVGNDAMDTLADAILGEGQLAIEATAFVADAIIAEMERINFMGRLQQAASEGMTAMSASLASGASGSKEASDAASQTAAARQAAAAGVMSAGNIGSREIVMMMDRTECGRAWLDPIRAAGEQSPEVVSN